MASIMNNNAKGAITQLMSAVEGAAIAMGQVFLPPLTAIIKKISEVVSSFTAWAKEHLPVVKAVLLNPALGNWGKVDFQPGWHKVSGLDREMYVCPEFMIQLEKMLVKDLKKPQDYLSLISLKDKVLDPTQTLDFLKDTKIVKIPDGDHRITDFAPHVEEIMSFLAE